jgi:hypothetical protein
MTSPDGFPPGSIQRKHPTKASKLQILEFIARVRGADYVSIANRFRLSESGARVKMCRLRKQSLVEPIPGTIGRGKAWQLTKAGWRDLRYLQEAEQYLGGTEGRLVSNLTAKVARLEAELKHWKGVVEDAPGVFRDVEFLANENLRLEDELAKAKGEIQRLRIENQALRTTIDRGRRR